MNKLFFGYFSHQKNPLHLQSPSNTLPHSTYPLISNSPTSSLHLMNHTTTSPTLEEHTKLYNHDEKVSLHQVVGIFLIYSLIRYICYVTQKENYDGSRSHSIFDHFEKTVLDLATKAIDKARRSSRIIESQETTDEENSSRTNQTIL